MLLFFTKTVQLLTKDIRLTIIILSLATIADDLIIK